MTKEERYLLIKDLCSRLPYSVKVVCLRDFNHKWYNLKMVDIGENEVYVTTYKPYANRYVEIEAVKPYLFPLSSMTEKQKKELNILRTYVSLNKNKEYLLFDWLNKNHFDYRGLIDMGLAIDATNLNIY